MLPVVYLVASSGMVLEVLGTERGTAWLVELGRATKIAAFALVPAFADRRDAPALEKQRRARLDRLA